MDAGDQNQVIRLQGKSPYLLYYFSGLMLATSCGTANSRHSLSITLEFYPQSIKDLA